MADKFLMIAITPEMPVAGEAEKIAFLLKSGFDFVHLRHPSIPAQEMEALLQQVPLAMRPRIKLHDMHDMAVRWNAGIHFNRRNPLTHSTRALPSSASAHHLSEVHELSSEVDYVFLSPIFDSISKHAYKSNFPDLEKLETRLGNLPVVALGGVDFTKIAILQRTGFRGAAMLGAIPWHLPLIEFKSHIAAICSNL